MISPEDKRQILHDGHRVLNDIREMPECTTMEIEEQDFLLFWQFQFNPEKGETATEQMKKYLYLLGKTHGIMYQHEAEEHKFLFYKKKKKS